MKKEELLKQLKENPNGIEYEKLPKDPELITYMKSLLNKKQAVWIKHLNGKWYYIKLKDKETAPFGKTQWIWEPTILPRSNK